MPALPIRGAQCQPGTSLPFGDVFLALLLSDALPANTLVRIRAEKRRGYKNVGDAFVKIVKDEGAVGLFKGCGPTVVRAMALNMGMFASNEAAKDAMASMGLAKGSQSNTMAAALVSGFFASACSLPFDYVKTQIQRMQPLPDGTMPYSGLMGE